MTTNFSPARRPCVAAPGPADVVGWRRCRLLEYGFPAELADALARQRVDLHALLQLVDRGCPPELAARILSPLDLPLDSPLESALESGLASPAGEVRR